MMQFILQSLVTSVVNPKARNGVRGHGSSYGGGGGGGDILKQVVGCDWRVGQKNHSASLYCISRT